MGDRCANITKHEKDIYAEMDRQRIDGHRLRDQLAGHPGADRIPLVKGPLLLLYAKNPHDPKWVSLAASYKNQPYVFLCKYSVELP